MVKQKKQLAKRLRDIASTLRGVEAILDNHQKQRTQRWRDSTIGIEFQEQVDRVFEAIDLLEQVANYLER